MGLGRGGFVDKAKHKDLGLDFQNTGDKHMGMADTWEPSIL